MATHETERQPDSRRTWAPSPTRIARANLTALMQDLAITDIPSLHRWSIDHLDEFLARSIARLGIHFRTPPARIMDLSLGVKSPRWLPGATLNIAESCCTAPPGTPGTPGTSGNRGNPAAPAIIFSTPGATGLSQWSFAELRTRANRVAHGLTRAGFAPGDALAILMPMTPDSVAIYLGIALAGCVVVSIADSFAAEEIQTRLRLANAKGIFVATHITRSGKRSPLYDRLRNVAGPKAIVLSDDANASGPAAAATTLRPGDLHWSDFLGPPTAFDALPRQPDDPLNILFSSGTTGEPKAIVWDHTTPLKAAVDAHWHHDLHPGDVVAWPTNLGWMMGPWLVFATLLHHATIALHHDAPLDRAFGQFVQDAKVNMLGVIPSLVRRWRETRCMEGLDWSALQTFSSTGECSNADDMAYLMGLANSQAPIIEYCGGTEIGGGFITSTVVQPNFPGTFSTPALGIDFVLLDEAGRPADEGELFLVPPALGLSQRLLHRDHNDVYFRDAPNDDRGRLLRRHGDQFQRLPNGYFRALGRCDDTMNLGGIKVSSAEIERVLLTIAGVKETAAIAANPPGGGPSLLVIFAVATPPAPARDPLLELMRRAIKDHLNPLFRIHDLVLLDALPRTASQKIMRRELRAQAERGGVRLIRTRSL